MLECEESLPLDAEDMIARLRWRIEERRTLKPE
jgi:hypothetical protein